ncbi:hypothetical protein ABVK25_008506 [Lepraria finkii]|uniref:Uncharacterized protein n=1 Tax=Lepraria finkii TaxID=1340010 RepID=A0ABR4B212_9LECA
MSLSKQQLIAAILAFSASLATALLSKTTTTPTDLPANPTGTLRYHFSTQPQSGEATPMYTPHPPASPTTILYPCPTSPLQPPRTPEPSTSTTSTPLGKPA